MCNVLSVQGAHTQGFFIEMQLWTCVTGISKEQRLLPTFSVAFIQPLTLTTLDYLFTTKDFKHLNT